MYYNTTNQSGSTLAEYKQSAISQDEYILALFDFYSHRRFTPFDIQKAYRLRDTPITSIRRSLNTLTKQGKLIKLDQTVPGKYGRPNHLWTLAK